MEFKIITRAIFFCLLIKLTHSKTHYDDDHDLQYLQQDEKEGGWDDDEEAHYNINGDDIYQWVEYDVVRNVRRQPEPADKAVYGEYDNDDYLHRLLGDCELTRTQFDKLKQFREVNPYVQRCYCEDGAVYCQLKKGENHLRVT